jgi:hypothetical protein
MFFFFLLLYLPNIHTYIQYINKNLFENIYTTANYYNNIIKYYNYIYKMDDYTYIYTYNE